MSGGKRLHELVLPVHFRGGGDKDRHHFTRGAALSDHHVAEKAGLFDLVVDGKAEFLRKAADRPDHSLGVSVVQAAGGYGHDLVAPGRVVAAGDPAVRAARYDLVDLAAVMERLVHPADPRNGAKRPKQLFEALLLLVQLPVIGEVVVFTAAAGRKAGAGGKCGHGGLPGRGHPAPL